MFNWKEFDRFKVILSQEASYQDVVGHHHVSIRPQNLLRWIELAGEDLGFFTLVEIAGADGSHSREKDFDFVLTYHLLNMGAHQRLNIHVYFNQSEVVPSIKRFFLNADWLEREQAELLGIKFNTSLEELILPVGQTNFPLKKQNSFDTWPRNHVRKLPLLKFNPNKSEQPFPEESYIWKHADVFSPLSMGLFDLQICLNQGRVVELLPEIGFFHQGLEKLFENKSCDQILRLIDRVNIGSAPTYSLIWARTIEDLLRFKVPERAQAIRIILLELARISEHLTTIHQVLFHLKLAEHRLFINAREKIYELIEKFCGARQAIGVIKFGGVSEDLPPGWIVQFQQTQDIVKSFLLSVHHSLISQLSFRQGLKSAEVNPQVALEWGITGPAMRACGLNFDLRKSHPFYFYEDIDFDVPVGIHGTAYERYLIRYEEIFQSLRIITQVIDNLPLGEIINPELSFPYQDLSHAFAQLELGTNWRYTGIEAASGEAGIMLSFKSGDNPYRLKIKTPSFGLVQGLTHFLRDVAEDNFTAALAGLGLSSAEIDR